MSRLLIILGFVFTWSCGVTTQDSSKLASWPNADLDVIAEAMRIKFISASILSQENLLLVDNSEWDCYSRSTLMQDYTEKRYKINFESKNGILRATGFKIDLPAFAFTEQGLSGASVFPTGNLAQLVLRMTEEGNLIGECLSEESYPGLQTYPVSITRKSANVATYVMCSRKSLTSPENPGIPGNCRENDEQFNTEEGGCLNFRSGKVWSMASPKKNVTYDEAESYCNNLKEGGKLDWRLPVLGDFDSATTDQGAVSHFRFNVDRRYWASSQGTTPKAMWVELSSGNRELVSKNDAIGSVVCVYEPLDRDGDGIPDSSDQCLGTVRGVEVTTTGPKKGCGT